MKNVETDKERILTNILESICSSCVIFPYADMYRDGHEYKTYYDWFSGTAKVGDLVMCNTIRDTKYKFGYVMKIHDSSHMDIREIGSNNICSISNEKFAPIRGMHNLELLEGKEYTVYRKILKAFYKYDEYEYKFGGLKFTSENKVILSVRQKWQENTFDIEFEYDSKITIKRISELMYEQGYGTKFKRQ